VVRLPSEFAGLEPPYQKVVVTGSQEVVPVWVSVSWQWVAVPA